jgi:hypothetical protein
MRWFGEPWPSAELRAPVCENDADRIPVPVGAPCLFCAELIEEGDRGEEMVYVSSAADLRFAHIECAFRQVMGGPAHVQGTCTCQGGHDDPDLGMSQREAAKAVWAQ